MLEELGGDLGGVTSPGRTGSLNCRGTVLRVAIGVARKVDGSPRRAGDGLRRWRQFPLSHTRPRIAPQSLDLEIVGAAAIHIQSISSRDFTAADARTRALRSTRGPMRPQASCI